MHNNQIIRTAEHVSEGHPDKFCDQVADRILDEALLLSKDDPEAFNSVRTAIECLAKDNLLIVSGEVRFPEIVKSKIDITALAQEAWERVGYGNKQDLTVINHIREQSGEIAGTAKKTTENELTGADQGGAGDQGIMVGFATNESDEMLPLCYLYARNICLKLQELRLSPTNDLFKNLRSDAKSQVTLTPEGRITEVIVAVQHNDGIEQQDIRQAVIQNVLKEVLPNIPDDEKLIINGTGSFVMGGTIGDAGVVGRKIVVDAYGPQVPVGGGAYSGKDPTKVDRSAAYMARHIAKRIIAEKVKGANECVVKIAYGIGQKQPAMVSAITDKGDVTDFVMEKFKDLSPGFIINRFNLRQPSGDPTLRVGNKEGWNYIDTASYGHYGRENFPWENLD